MPTWTGVIPDAEYAPVLAHVRKLGIDAPPEAQGVDNAPPAPSPPPSEPAAPPPGKTAPGAP
jgi:hypothetical protein